MVRKYKRYEEYKDSGVEWIGEIPEEWKLIRFKYLFSYQKGNSPNEYVDQGRGVPYLSMDYLRGNSAEITYVSNANNMIKVKKDQILLLWDGSNSGEFIKSKKGLLSSTMSLITDMKIDKEFSYYYFKSSEKYLKDQTIGMGIPHVDSKILKNLHLSVPEKDEQQKISSFLNQKTTEVDEIINKKEKLIDQLEKYKKSVITEAVTKGKLGDKYINEDGELVDEIEMKDSGFEWIGEIPEYWEVSKIKYISNINQKTLNENIDSNKIIKYIDIGSVNSNGQIEEIQKMKFKDSPSRARRIISDGDTIVSTVRTYLKAITSFDKVENNLICSTGFAVLSPNNKIISDYLAFLMRSSLYIDEIVRNSFGVSYPAINSSILGNLDCILPDINTQKKITNFINFKINKIDNLVNKTKKSIEKYKEYKKSLIFEAVTGKIDLRDYKLEGGEKLAEHNNSSETKRECFSAVD